MVPAAFVIRYCKTRMNKGQYRINRITGCDVMIRTRTPAHMGLLSPLSGNPVTANRHAGSGSVPDDFWYRIIRYWLGSVVIAEPLQVRVEAVDLILCPDSQVNRLGGRGRHPHAPDMA